VLDLGPRSRVAFACGWLALQSALVLTASARADGVFGFRMFPEASTWEVHLGRALRAGEIPAPQGKWSARDASGQVRHFEWRDRVRDPVLSSLDARVFASYGADTQLARLQQALDDVADHVPSDDETVRLVAHVRVWRNGRAPESITLGSHVRPVP
jgi:hypothetical protein